jgi:DeoR/GlpR family transcriptional regulator of sugar metabolism
MGVSEIVVQIDRELALLQKARTLLASSGSAVASKSVSSAVAAAKTPVAKKRNLSPEGRKRIAEAVKRRWAAHRKSVSGS